jgi:hypothetical protein
MQFPIALMRKPAIMLLLKQEIQMAQMIYYKDVTEEEVHLFTVEASSLGLRAGELCGAAYFQRLRVEAKMNDIIINPTNEAEALERIKTLPWAFSSREDGEQMISQWKAGNREEVFEALRAEIHCHEQADNWSKATYIRNVQRALQLAQITLRRAR